MSATSAKEQPTEIKAGGSHRTPSLSDAKSNIANCDNQEKPTKTVEKNRLTSQGVETDASTSSLQENRGILINGGLVLTTNTESYNSTIELEETCVEDEEKAQDLSSTNIKANIGEVEVHDLAKDLKPRKDFPNDASTSVDQFQSNNANRNYEEEEKKKVTKEKEIEDKEEEEKKAKEKNEEEKKVKKDEKDKAQTRRKRKRDQRKAGAEEGSSSLEIDNDLSPDAYNAKDEPAVKETKLGEPSRSQAAPNNQASSTAAASTEGKVGHLHPNTLAPTLEPTLQLPAPVSRHPNTGQSVNFNFRL